MRRLLLPVLTFFAISTVAATAEAAHVHASKIHVSVTGEIRNLGLARITVGHLACTIPSKLTVSADRFVIGDSVKIACLSGKLLSVKYAPESAVSQSNSAGAPPGATSSKPATGAETGFSIGVVCSGTVTPSSGNAATTCANTPAGSISTATGTLTSLDASSITVGALTCSVPPGVFSLFGSSFQVGQSVRLGCYANTGQFASIHS